MESAGSQHRSEMTGSPWSCVCAWAVQCAIWQHCAQMEATWLLCDVALCRGYISVLNFDQMFSISYISV